MKASLAALAGTLLLISCPWALAASSTDLSVKGTITPSACTPSVSNGGTVDYGKLSFKDLKPTSWTTLADTMLQVRISCEAVTRFALQPRDNRPEHPAPTNPNMYSLGMVNDNVRVGGYWMYIFRPVADNRPVSALRSADNGQTWTIITPGIAWTPGALTSFGDNWSGVLAPWPAKELTFDLRINPSIAPTQTLPADQQMPLDGSATLDLVYL
ncbi:DUF1120 domain-containing protein [Pseudomonas sp. SDO528_S397]